MTYYAHSVEGLPEDEWESLPDHLRIVGDLAANNAAPFKAEMFARASGNLHDIGKVDPDFDRRLHGENVRVDHSTAGAILALRKYGATIGKMLAFGIAGHHAGLANGARPSEISSLKDRLARGALPPIPPECDLAPAPAEFTAPLPMQAPGYTPDFSAHFLTRMIFSCLVDADFLATEAFYAGVEKRRIDRGGGISILELRDTLMHHMLGVLVRAEDSPVNRLRAEVLEASVAAAPLAPGLFSMTVPTGGGKTLASTAFALEHAVQHGKRRVIYVIPYTSIIEQTAAVLRAALGSDDAVLEHHSAFDTDKMPWRGRAKLRLDSQNWDRPIVVTTAVQFFESLFANRPSRCRKLHALANSVIVIDEAQTMPLRFLHPCIEAIRELARGYGASVVLCTATQPALRVEDGFVAGLSGVREIAPEPKSLYQRLKRVAVETVPGQLDDADLAGRLVVPQQVMCIVNNRRHAHDLYRLIADEDGARHLSTWMCAAHRRDVLDGIKADLKAGNPVRLVSTSLVEAGVDISFPEVWRALSGLDSIIQAAGRCNRNGELDGLGRVFVFRPAEGGMPPHDVRQYAAAAESVLRDHSADPISLDAILAYFRDIYWRRGQDELDAAVVGDGPAARPGILRALAEHKSSGDFPFADIARAFRMIPDRTVPLIILYPGVQPALTALKSAETVGGIARRLQQYIVQVDPRLRQKLIDAGHAKVLREADFGDQFVVLENIEMYDSAVGLDVIGE